MKSTPVPCFTVVFFLAMFLTTHVVPVLGTQDLSQPSASHGHDTNSKTQLPNEQIRDLGLFRALWKGDALNLNYLLEELNIVGYQRSELKRIAEQTRNEVDAFSIEFHKEQVKRGELFSYFDDPFWMDKFLGIQRRLVTGIEDALLPGQMKKLRQVLAQRAILKSKSVESFVLPLVVSVKIGMEQQARQQFQKDITPIVTDFQSSKKQLFEKAWKKILPHFPGESTNGMFELLNLIDGLEKFRTPGKRVDPTSLKTWTKDDFQEFENETFKVAVINAVFFDALKQVVQLQEYQVDAITKEIKRVNSLRTSDDFIDPGYAAIIENTPDPNGDLRELKAENARKMKIVEDHRQQLTREIVGTVLLSHQIEKLRLIAKFSRFVYESKYGDEFGVVVAWSKSLNDPTLDEAKLTETVASARKEFYIELKKLRKKVGEQVLDAMPIEAKTKFNSVYGEQLYDYQSEKVAGWNEYRKSSR